MVESTIPRTLNAITVRLATVLVVSMLTEVRMMCCSTHCYESFFLLNGQRGTGRHE